jgi:O-antigen/teichoic acid export membrane protein
MTFITILFIILVPYIYKIFIDERFHSGILVAKIISIGFLMNGLYYLVTNYIVYTKRTEILSYITTTISIIGGVTNYYLILKFGIIGAGYGLIITFGLLFLTVFYYANKLYKMPWFLN